MTRAVKWWKRFSFYNKLKMIFGAFGVGGEITNVIAESVPKWHIVTIVATLLAIGITHIIQDNDGNDIVDLFQKRVVHKKRTVTDGKVVEETKTTTTTEINQPDNTPPTNE